MNSIRTHIREYRIKTLCTQIAADEQRLAIVNLSSADGEKVVLVHVFETARPGIIQRKERRSNDSDKECFL